MAYASLPYNFTLNLRSEAERLHLVQLLATAVLQLHHPGFLAIESPMSWHFNWQFETSYYPSVVTLPGKPLLGRVLGCQTVSLVYQKTSGKLK